MSEISPDLIERMVALVRDMASRDDGTILTQVQHSTSFMRAREIAALLPEPVDPDLIEARAVAAHVHLDMHGSERSAEAILNGRHDDWILLISCVAAIKRGRELAALGEPVGRRAAA